MIDIPDALAAEQVKINGVAGRQFIAAPPDLARAFLHRWGSRGSTGRPRTG